MKARSDLISRDRGEPRRTRTEAVAVRLSQLAVGAVARLQRANLDSGEAGMLRALGLTSRSVVRVCKTGDPCIVQVRTTRIGISRSVADNILVVPDQSR